MDSNEDIEMTAGDGEWAAVSWDERSGRITAALNGLPAAWAVYRLRVEVPHALSLVAPPSPATGEQGAQEWMCALEEYHRASEAHRYFGGTISDLHLAQTRLAVLAEKRPHSNPPAGAS